MQTTQTRSTCRLQKRWVLNYQDAAGTPEDEILDRAFASEDAALAWADAHFVVPLWLDEEEQLVGDNGHIIGVVRERHEI